MKSTISHNTALALCELKDLMDRGERVSMTRLCVKHRVARSTLWRAIRRGELANVVTEKIGNRIVYTFNTRGKP